MRIYLSLLLLLNISCSNIRTGHEGGSVDPSIQVKIPLLSSSLFSRSENIPTINQVFGLNEIQKQQFLRYFHHPDNRSTRPNMRIVDFLGDRLSNFNYHSDTLTASQALAQNRGNCLSLAILTKSLAALAEVDVNYQLVETPPVYQKANNIVLSSEHIRTKLLNPKEEANGLIYFGRGGVLVDYFPAQGTRMLRPVDHAEFSAMYYRNIAAELIIKKQMNTAYWYLLKALELNNNDPHAINMIALIYEKSAYIKAADKLYQFGIERSEEKLDLLNNYYTFLKHQRRNKKANEINTALQKYDDPNPFKWISLANTAFNERQYDKALQFYKKSNKLAPYLHEGYAGIARTQVRLGQYSSARNSIEKAIENTHKKDTKKIYQKKFDMLSQLLGSN